MEEWSQQANDLFEKEMNEHLEERLKEERDSIEFDVDKFRERLIDAFLAEEREKYREELAEKVLEAVKG